MCAQSLWLSSPCRFSTLARRFCNLASCSCPSIILPQGCSNSCFELLFVPLHFALRCLTKTKGMVFVKVCVAMHLQIARLPFTLPWPIANLQCGAMQWESIFFVMMHDFYIIDPVPTRSSVNHSNSNATNSQLRSSFQTQDRVKAKAEKGNPRPVRTAGVGKEFRLKQIFLGRR